MYLSMPFRGFRFFHSVIFAVFIQWFSSFSFSDFRRFHSVIFAVLAYHPHRRFLFVFFLPAQPFFTGAYQSCFSFPYAMSVFAPEAHNSVPEKLGSCFRFWFGCAKRPSGKSNTPLEPAGKVPNGATKKKQKAIGTAGPAKRIGHLPNCEDVVYCSLINLNTVKPYMRK